MVLTGHIGDMLDMSKNVRRGGVHVRPKVRHEIDTDDAALVRDRADRGIEIARRSMIACAPVQLITALLRRRFLVDHSSAAVPFQPAFSLDPRIIAPVG
jgi:hypothetical protein